MHQVPRHLPCTKCGECCRHGGECVFRNWGHDSTPIEFEDVCKFLNEDSTCQRVADSFANGHTAIRKIVIGRCDWPAQFLRNHCPELYKQFIDNEEYHVD